MNEYDPTKLPMPLFFTGQVVATPAALELLEDAGLSAVDLVARHTYGDWSEMCSKDQVQNLLAVRDGFRVFSSYRIGEGTEATRVWVITEADRRTTTLLLPEEY